MIPSRRPLLNLPRQTVSYPPTVESYESFDVCFEIDLGGRVSVHRDRPGCKKQPFRPPEVLRSSATGYDEENRTPQDIGSELFRAVFHGSLARELERSLARLRRGETRGLRLRLVLDPSEPRLAEISALPWELLYDPDHQRFFGQDPRTPIVRFIAPRSASDPMPTDPPLSILVAHAEPRGLGGLRLAREAERLYEATDGTRVQLKLVRIRSPGELRRELDRGGFQILHFMGHGMLDRRSGEGILLFENRRGGVRKVTGRELALELRGISTLRLVVLNACETAAPTVPATGSDPYLGVASALVLEDVPAVVAMRSGISDAAAVTFSEALYEHLARRDPIEEAVAEARLRLAREHARSIEWATPVLCLQSMDGDLFDLSGKRRETKPRWRTWTARGAAAGLLLALAWWTLRAAGPRPSPARASAYLTNPPECQPVIPELNLHFVRIEPGLDPVERVPADGSPRLSSKIIPPFCLGKYEITRRQWWYVMKKPHGLPKPAAKERFLPVEGVSHDQALAFIDELNRLADAPWFRLPRDTDWELAATRGFPDFDRMDEPTLRLYANCGSFLEDGYDGPTPVGTLKEDQAGLFDMLGNASEWVEATSPIPTGKAIRRGGSHASGESTCGPRESRAVLRDRQQHATGFRIVRDIEPSPL